MYRLFRWGTYLYGDGGGGGLFFILFKFWVFGLLRGYKGKKYLKIKNNNYICHEPYLRNSIAYDHDFWYTNVKWKYFQVFFSFFSKLLKIAQKMAQNGKKFCLLCFISQEPYIIWLSFDCFNDLSVNANPISVRLKSKRQHINTVTFYIGDILMPLVGVFFSNI